jgi:hypothetical protein
VRKGAAVACGRRSVAESRRFCGRETRASAEEKDRTEEIIECAPFGRAASRGGVRSGGNSRDGAVYAARHTNEQTSNGLMKGLGREGARAISKTDKERCPGGAMMIGRGERGMGLLLAPDKERQPWGGKGVSVCVSAMLHDSRGPRRALASVRASNREVIQQGGTRALPTIVCAPGLTTRAGRGIRSCPW